MINSEPKQEITANQVQFNVNGMSGDYINNTIESTLTYIANQVRRTYGPYGSHYMIMGQNLQFNPTKDGLEVISKLRADRAIPTAVLNLVNNAAIKLVTENGDGSTSMTLLLYLLYKNLGEVMNRHKLSPNEFKEKCENMVNHLISELKKSSNKLNKPEDLYDLIYTSVDGGKDIADAVYNMMMDLDVIGMKDFVRPVIIIKKSDTAHSFHKLINGIEIEGCTIRPDIFFPEGMTSTTHENPYIFLVDGIISFSTEMLFELTHIAYKEERSIVFIGSGVSESLIEAFVRFSQQDPNTFNRLAFYQTKLSVTGDVLFDLSASLGTQLIDGYALQKITTTEQIYSYLNNSTSTAEKVNMGENFLRVVAPKFDQKRVDIRIKEIDDKIKVLKERPDAFNTTIDDLEIRKAGLMRKFGTLFIGGETNERKNINLEHARDAVPQVVNSLKYGYVEGCNTAILKVIYEIINNDEIMELGDYDIMSAIKDAYKNLFIYIVLNYTNDYESAKTLVEDHIDKNGFVPYNLRGTSNRILNSAYVDEVILKTASDMATMLLTSAGVISASVEFNITQV